MYIIITKVECDCPHCAAESLQARGDLALADAYLDCAAQLGELIGG